MDAPVLAGRTALVTGANRGIGLHTTQALAEKGARVVLAVRDEDGGKAAADDVRDQVPGADLEVLRLDLADLDDVRRFADDFLGTHDALHVLVNNAGFHMADRAVTPQGYESTFAVCHLGHFALTMRLLPLLVESAPSRIVNVASEAHRAGRIHFDDLMLERRWSGIAAYAQAKLANIMFTYALARRLEGTGVTANAVHPGSVRTGWARGAESGLFRFVVKAASPFLISPEKGARTSVRVASSPDVEGVNGQYFVRSMAWPSSRRSRNVAAQERLWDESERLTGVRFEDVSPVAHTPRSTP